ncbi:MAG: HU family DNA-binding protein, partial [Chloroflexi bacterium]|nr:HU family DNA-binding protein [Chloroflexota bacterium]
KKGTAQVRGGGVRMKKAETADRLAARSGLSKAVVKEAVEGVFGAIGDPLANAEEVRIAGFGTLDTRSRPATTGRNARTGEAVKAGKTRKDAVNAGVGS